MSEIYIKIRFPLKVTEAKNITDEDGESMINSQRVSVFGGGSVGVNWGRNCNGINFISN